MGAELEDLVVAPGFKNFGGYFAKQCREFVRKENSSDYPEEWKDPLPPALLARFEAGKMFEAGLLEELREGFSGVSGVVILEGVEDRSDHAAMDAWEESSMEAFRDPSVWFVANPRLAPVPGYNLTGEPDFAVRAEDGFWYPMDAKDHSELTGSAKAKPRPVSFLLSPKFESAVEVEMVGSPRKENALQLAHYHFMFQAHGLGPTGPDAVARGAIIGRSRQWVWYDLKAPQWRHLSSTLSTLELYVLQRNDRMTVVQLEAQRTAGKDVNPDSAPEKKSECPSCEWRTVCHDEMVSMDEVTLVPSVTVPIAADLRDGGVRTRRDLSLLDHRTARLKAAGIDVAGLQAAAANEPVWSLPAGELYQPRSRSKKRLATLDTHGVHTIQDVVDLSDEVARLGGRAVAPLPKLIDQARVSTVGRVYKARGVDALSLPRAEVEIDIDFEDSEGYTYMFGALVTHRGDESTSKYHSFCSWDQSEDGEGEAFVDFWKFLMRRKDAYSSVRYYHYSPHEKASMVQLARRHAEVPGCPTIDEVQTLFKSDLWVDMYPIVSSQLVWPTKSHSVKDIARFCGHEWSGDGVDGALSLAWYDTATKSEDPEEREQYQRDLLTYNRQDNEATLRIRNWLTQPNFDWDTVTSQTLGDHIPPVEGLDERFQRMAQYR